MVQNLCTIWVGRFKLQANIARFQRPPLKGVNPQEKRDDGTNSRGFKSPDIDKEPTKMGRSFAKALTGQRKSESNSSPAIVLEDECQNTIDLSNSLMGRVKEFVSLVNIKKAFNNEGFSDISIRFLVEKWVLLDFPKNNVRDAFQACLGVTSWFTDIRQASVEFLVEGRIMWVDVEGVPFKLWSDKTFMKIASKWGELLDVDDLENSCYHSKRLCISTRMMENVYETFKIIFKGEVFWIRAKEVPGWVPEFVDNTDDESSMEEGI